MGKLLDIQKVDDGIIFKIKVQPASDKNEIVGVKGDALKIKINAPAVKGKANKTLVDFLAGKLGVNNSGIEIISGHTTLTHPLLFNLTISSKNAIIRCIKQRSP